MLWYKFSNCYKSIMMSVLQYNLILILYKLQNSASHYNLRKFSICSWAVNIWNSLPDSVVYADTLNTFKSQTLAWSRCSMGKEEYVHLFIRIGLDCCSTRAYWNDKRCTMMYFVIFLMQYGSSFAVTNLEFFCVKKTANSHFFAPRLFRNLARPVI